VLILKELMFILTVHYLILLKEDYLLQHTCHVADSFHTIACIAGKQTNNRSTCTLKNVPFVPTHVPYRGLYPAVCQHSFFVFVRPRSRILTIRGVLCFPLPPLVKLCNSTLTNSLPLSAPTLLHDNTCAKVQFSDL
jgi:hypothetical protein